MSEQGFKTVVSVDRLFLATDNPRHVEVDDEKEAIDRLCKDEMIEELAKDIVRYGLNPAERLIVFPADESITDQKEVTKSTTFVVAEGNRRMCALKLLHDPDLAPARLRGVLERAAEGATLPKDLDAVVIFDPEVRRHWMRRIHDGAQGGKGRKAWNSEQRTRFTGDRRNVVAQALFDYAVKNGLMTDEERKGNFSHMSRLVGNALVAEALGIDTSKGVDELEITRPREIFEAALRVIIDEAKDKTLGSQAKKAQIDRWSRQIADAPGYTSERTDPVPLMDDAAVVNPGSPKPSATASQRAATSPQTSHPETSSDGKPKAKSSKTYVKEDLEVTQGLKDASHDKLLSLYNSICQINCQHHTPLVAVGTWAFLETISAAIGRPEDKAFPAFFNRGKQGKLAELGLGSGKEVNALSEALERVSRYGNSTKHHSTSAFWEYRQIINDMETLTPLFKACIKEMET